MEDDKKLSNLLVTYEGTLVLLADRDFEILGIEEMNEELIFKLQN